MNFAGHLGPAQSEQSIQRHGFAAHGEFSKFVTGGNVNESEIAVKVCVKSSLGLGVVAEMQPHSIEDEGPSAGVGFEIEFQPERVVIKDFIEAGIDIDFDLPAAVGAADGGGPDAGIGAKMPVAGSR